MGKVLFGWVDYSLCEKVFSITRDGANFASDIAHNTKQQCNDEVKPESTYDDLRLGAGPGKTGPRKVGTGHSVRPPRRLVCVRLMPSTDKMLASICHNCRILFAKRTNTLRMRLQPGTCPFSVLGFWGNMTMPSAGTMAYRRYLPSTTMILSIERGTAKNRYVSGAGVLAF